MASDTCKYKIFSVVLKCKLLAAGTGSGGDASGVGGENAGVCDGIGEDAPEEAAGRCAVGGVK